MGHLLLLILHAIAALFFWPALFVTVPLHLIYGISASSASARARSAPNPRTHVKCPWCRELVDREASVCPHCRKEVTPVGPIEPSAVPVQQLAVAALVVVLLVFAAKFFR